MEEKEQTTEVKLGCGVYGEATVFPVKVARGAKVSALQEAVARVLSTEQNRVAPRLLTLYLARKNGEWLKDDCHVKAFLRAGISTEYEEMRPLSALNDEEYFGESFWPRPKEIHVLVEPPTDKMNAKRQKVEHSTSLKELWQYSELHLEKLPSPHQLAKLLQKPLPFKLTLRDSVTAAGVFDQDGPLISCPDLTLLMDYFLQLCNTPVAATASEYSWQVFYDVLHRISNSMCFGNGLMVEPCRNCTDATESTVLRKRPDYILLHNRLVLMRGEEKSFLNTIDEARMDLATKMRQWNVMIYGELPYILGYATSGSDLEVVAIARTDGPCRPTSIVNFNILVNKGGALKLFYNLAMLIYEMIKLAKQPYRCGLQPFKPDENEKRKIVLMDGVIERTINSANCINDPDFERLISIYETLEGLNEGSSVTHLQTVEKMYVKDVRRGRTTHRRLVVELSPIGYLRVPTSDEVSEWLRQMLVALTYWHGCGYCHGDIRWRNIVYVPAPGLSYWVLIDMDESHRSNTTEIGWNHPRQGDKLRFEHDLFQLGRLMEGLPFTLSEDLQSMRDLLKSAVDTPGLTAEVVLARLE